MYTQPNIISTLYMHNPHKFILPPPPFQMHTNLSKTPPFTSTSKYPPKPPHFLIIHDNPWKFTHKCIDSLIDRNLQCLTPVTNTDTYSATTPQDMHRLFSKQHYHDPNMWHLLDVLQFVSHGLNNKHPDFQFHHRWDQFRASLMFPGHRPHCLLP